MASFGFRLRRAYRKLRWRMLRGGPGRTPRILTVPTANGILSFSNMDLHNGKGLYVQRAWEIDSLTRSMEYLRREGHLSRPGADVMIDVGANIGMICIAMLKHGYFREAVAIEPAPGNFELLTRNIAQNGYAGSIRAFHGAVSDVSGEIEIELSAENEGDHRVRAPRSFVPALMEEEKRRVVRVPALTLDELLTTAVPVDPKRIGLVWVDVQGHEGQLFRGAGRVLSHGAPVLNEFWPYGILRSGLDRNSYGEIIRAHFSHFAIVDAGSGTFEAREAGAIGDLFDTLTGPEQYREVIYFPRRDVSSS